MSDISTSFPANADQAYLAYAQSYNLLDYMYKTFGISKMTQLIKFMNNPQQTFDQDLTQAIGEDEIHLENQWRLSNGQSDVLTTSDTHSNANTAAGNSSQTSPEHKHKQHDVLAVDWPRGLPRVCFTHQSDRTYYIQPEIQQNAQATGENFQSGTFAEWKSSLPIPVF